MDDVNFATGGFYVTCKNGHIWLALSTNADKTKEDFLNHQHCPTCKEHGISLVPLTTKDGNAER